ncbi:MAG: sensor histidine kinase [Bacteroidales bacterium]
MKLFNRILLQISPVLILVMSLWAFFFYHTIINEINDEVDDSLEEYAEMVIIKKLSGEEIPHISNGTNNQYFIKEVSKDYTQKIKEERFIDSMIFIPAKKETEPARILRTYFMDNDHKYWMLTIATPTIEKSDLQESILKWMLILYASLLVVIIFINIWLFRTNMRPLYKLLHWLDRYKVGNENEPLDNNTDIIEFQKLNEAAIRNVTRAEKQFEEQKQFIGNASHEIQTPIAICRNRLEMLMEDETLSEMQLSELMKVHNTLCNVAKLNKSLLLLSKIDNGQFTETDHISVDKLITRFLTDFEEVYDYMDLKISRKITQDFFLSMNDSLADILIANLLKNAFVHNVAGGFVDIEINSNELIIANTGVDNPLDGSKIFERFYHTNRKENSTGLGMSLVKSICKRYGLHCKYVFSDGLHVFKVYKDNEK